MCNDYITAARLRQPRLWQKFALLKYEVFLILGLRSVSSFACIEIRVQFCLQTNTYCVQARCSINYKLIYFYTPFKSDPESPNRVNDFSLNSFPYVVPFNQWSSSVLWLYLQNIWPHSNVKEPEKHIWLCSPRREIEFARYKISPNCKVPFYYICNLPK
jgi:hypothetical protein